MKADFVAGGEGRRIGRLQWMQSDFGIMSPHEIGDAHDRAASTDAGNKRIRSQPVKVQLPPNFRARRLRVGFDVGFVRKLRREKHVLFMLCKLFSHANAAEKSALIATHGNDLRAEASN